ILEKALLKWYASPKVYWEELYTMYTSFFIMRVRLPLHISKKNTNHPCFLLDISKAYYSYLFSPNERPEPLRSDYENDETEAKDNEEKNTTLKTGVHFLKAGLSWCNMSEQHNFTDIDYLIYVKLQTNIKNEISDEYTKLSFTKIAPDKLKKDDWEVLTDIDVNKMPREVVYEMYDFLQLTIKLYFQKPNIYKSLIEWYKSEKTNHFQEYVRERFYYYACIRKHYSLTNENFATLENEQNNDQKIPIADLVFYCQTLPYHLGTSSEKQKVLHPLTEFEFVTILKIIKSKINNEKKKSNHEQDNPLFKIKLSFSDWEALRKGEKLKSENEPSTESNSNQKTNDSKKYTQLLFSLLTNRPWHSHVRKNLFMYTWND